MGNRVCRATGKVSFVRHQDAEKVMAHYSPARKRGLVEAPQAIYRCVSCNRWHLTCMTPAESAEYTRLRGKPPRHRRKHNVEKGAGN